MTARAPSLGPAGGAAPLAPLARLRRTLVALLLGRALLAGAATALVVLAVARMLARLGVVVPSFPDDGGVLAVALLAGLAVAAALALRARRLGTERVALWVEERVPGLEYALVTAAEPRHAPLVPQLAPRLAGVPWARLGSGAAARALGPAALALVAAGGAYALAGATVPGIVGGAASGAGRGVAAAIALPPESVLGELRATVRPPAYSRLRAETLDDPTSVPGLVGSAVELRGEGDRAVTATLGGRELAARSGDGWRVALVMPESAGVVRLADGVAERLVVLEPRPDSIPTVVLDDAVRDTVVRTPIGSIPLLARAHDDVGLASSGFEFIVSSGEGESFTFRSGTVGAASHGGRREAELRAALRLDSLGLKPGDVVHVRAVARDGNTLSGPGVGASETRVVRVARLGEYDSVAVEGAPPPTADTTALSQRMLLLLTERLEARRPRLERPEVLREAQTIARDQTRLRKRVGELVYMRLGDDVGGEHAHFAGDGHDHGTEGRLDPEQLLARASAATGGMPGVTDFHGDETPVVAVNKPLLEAYNHMWDASRALDLGEPDDAIPPMRLALAALQRARQAERIYLRGRPPTVVVDLAKARLQGKEKGAGSVRDAGRAEDGGRAARARRLDAALALLARDAGAAVDSLLLLRVDALGDDRALAAALDEAVRRLRAGDDATAALRRARRAAAGEPAAEASLPRWGGA